MINFPEAISESLGSTCSSSRGKKSDRIYIRFTSFSDWANRRYVFSHSDFRGLKLIVVSYPAGALSFSELCFVCFETSVCFWYDNFKA